LSTCIVDQRKKTSFEKAKEVLFKAQNSGQPIACFMSEVAVITLAGMVINPTKTLLRATLSVVFSI